MNKNTLNNVPTIVCGCLIVIAVIFAGITYRDSTFIPIENVIGAGPFIYQKHFRWRDDTTALNTDGGWLAAEDQHLPDAETGTPYRIRISALTTLGPSSVEYQLQYTNKVTTCAAATGWAAPTALATIEMINSASISPDGQSLTPGRLTSGGYTFVSGEGRDTNNKTSGLVIMADRYTELEYSIVVTNLAPPGETYCFRLYNALASQTLDQYDVYPELTVEGIGSPPSDPSTAPDMTAGTDTGTSDTDNITNDNTPNFTGSCTDGETVTLYEGASTVIGSQVCASSAYTITSSTLADGVKIITSTFTNGSGESGKSPELSVTIDTSTPASPTVSDPTPSQSVGPSPTVAGTCESDTTVSISNASLAVNPTTTSCGGGSYSTSVSFTSGGAQTLNITQTDSAGNTSGAATVDITVTMSVPPDPVTAPNLTSETDSGESSTDNITNDNTPDFTGTCTTGETVTLYRAGVTTIGSQVCSGGVYTITSSVLTDAVHSITSTFTNVVGESNHSPDLSVTIDTTTPTTPTISTPTNGQSVPQSPTISGSCEAGETISIANAVLAVNPTTVVCGAGTYSTVITFTDGGSQILSVTQADDAGNVSSAATINVIAPFPVLTGGGWAWNVLRQRGETTGPPPPATLRITVFQDLNQNQKQDRYDSSNPFAGLTLTVTGTAWNGLPLEQTISLDASGTATASLSPSSASGYIVTLETSSSVLTDFKSTTLTTSKGIVLGSSDTYSLSFGFRPKNLLGYEPCLTIEDIPDPAQRSDAYVLLSSLRDSFKLPVLRGVSLDTPLISRKDFLLLLQRTQCIPLDDTTFAANTFIDLKPTAPFAPVLAALLRREFPVVRSTPLGSAADISSPINRKEALLLLSSALPLPTPEEDANITLPSDLHPDHELTPVFLALADLGIFPSSFSTLLAPNSGLTPREAMMLIIKSSFVAGKIPITPSDWEDDTPSPATRPAPPFLSFLPALPQYSCLEQSPERSTAVRFHDVFPGDSLYQDVAWLLSLGTKNTNGKILWLLPATRRLAEFGVLAGETPLNPDVPVSIEETVRSLLVLSCLPMDTSATVRNGPPALVGTAQSNVPRDRITGLSRNATLASRIIYKAQDHQRAYDLSLFTYADDLLSDDIRKPTDSLSVSEGAGLFASALLGIAVRDQVISPQEAEFMSSSVRQSILAYLVGKDFLTWRDGNVGHADLLTRRMLIQFLAAVTEKEKQSTLHVPLGKLWWERVQ